MDGYDFWGGVVLAGIGALICGFSWARKSVFGIIVGLILLTLGWFELFIY